MEGLWNYINYDSSGVYMYGVLAGGVLGVCLLVAALYLLLVCGKGAQVCLGVRVDVIRWPNICCRPQM